MNKQLKLSASSRYANARANLLLVVLFTFLNVILAVAGSGVYMLFSATIPYFFATLGKLLLLEGYPEVVLIVFVVIALVLTVPYLIFWIFSKKRWGFMVAALVYFSLDFISLFMLFELQDMIIDILFHIWVMYFLIMGVSCGRHAFEESDDTVIENSTYTEDEFGYITSRQITLVRSKSFAGSAVPYTCIFTQDGRERRFQLEKGRSLSIPVSSSRYQIKVVIGSAESEPFIGDGGTENKHYLIDTKVNLFKGTSFTIREVNTASI